MRNRTSDITFRQDPEQLEYQKSKGIHDRSPFSFWGSQEPIDLVLKMTALSSAWAWLVVALQMAIGAQSWPIAVFLAIIKMGGIAYIIFRFRNPGHRAALFAVIGVGTLAAAASIAAAALMAMGGAR